MMSIDKIQNFIDEINSNVHRKYYDPYEAELVGDDVCFRYNIGAYDTSQTTFVRQKLKERFIDEFGKDITDKCKFMMDGEEDWFEISVTFPDLVESSEMRKGKIRSIISRLLEGETFDDIYANLTSEDFIDYEGRFSKIIDVNDCNNYPGDLTVYSEDYIEPVSEDDGDGLSFAICDPGLLSNDPQEVVHVLYCTVLFSPAIDPDWFNERLIKLVKDCARTSKSVKPLLNKLVDMSGFKSIEFEYDQI